ncbi:MAG: pyruvate formate-lyase [Clostridia bacterium]|nr:pyruvate formate-lyase [Clostridia bacterium]
MTDRIRRFLNDSNNKVHHKYRKSFDTALVEQYRSLKTPTERMAKRLELVLASETPVVDKEAKIVLLRTVHDIPSIFTDEEYEAIHKDHYFHELGYLSNLCPNYAKVIKIGFSGLRAIIDEKYDSADADGKLLYDAVRKELDAVTDLMARYKAEAEKVGNTVVADILSRIPEMPATSFNEALQFFRILHYTLWAEGTYHNTIGRFDQFMYPYFAADIAKGVPEEELYELICEFFISFNIDSDKYVGVQQGDNGQSMMLGGVDRNGNDAYNRLSELCLEASGELLVIDPKINLRVDKNTPHERYVKGTHLTKAGLGFPQYSNDDIVIPGLVDLGYSLEDARDYAVAACWEYIIPGVGMDIANINAVSFPKVVTRTIDKYLVGCPDMETFVAHFKNEVMAECDAIEKDLHNLYIFPSPWMSTIMDNCIENGRDVTLGSKYNNFGIHGTGIACATDSLASIDLHIFKDKDVDATELIKATKANFEGYETLKTQLRYGTPKMGNDNDDVDKYSVMILDTFADCLKGGVNERGGIYRVGTGSAMFYLWHAAAIDATPDGRGKGEPFGTNYSPNLFSKVDGPMSVIKSFTKQNLSRTINGGPLTMEFHQDLFNTDEGIEKTASLVEAFINLGGHQMQLNAVNRDVLKDAQKHPENYKNLIVRIWGWSAYFCELDKEYQDHVIARHEYALDSQM